MFEVKLETVVSQLVRNHFRHPHYVPNENEALHVAFDCSLRNFETGNERRATIHLLFHSRFGGSISVFGALTHYPEVPVYEFQGCHDTCWRDSMERFINKVYFAWSEEIQGDLRPYDLHQFVHFDGFGDRLTTIKQVKVTMDKTDKNNHRRIVEIL